MADETTPRLNLVKPEVGGSADTWGDKWNENADKIDAAIIKPDEENVWSAPQHFDGGLYAGATSPTDTTPGRLLKVGDFGVGQTIGIPQGADLNDYITPGEYKQDMNDNASPELNYPVKLAGSLKVVRSTNGAVQEYTSYGSTRRKFLRGMHDGVWSSWVEFYHTGNDASLVKTSRTISTGTGLTGGGNLSANRTISLASSHIPIGVGQTWQNVSSQRAWDTTYTNTTGRPIFVAVKGLSLPATDFYIVLEVDGVHVSSSQSGNVSSPESDTVTGLVPPGSTYRARSDGMGESVLWTELR